MFSFVRPSKTIADRAAAGAAAVDSFRNSAACFVSTMLCLLPY